MGDAKSKDKKERWQKTTNTANTEAGRSALSKAFSEAKERRDKGTQEGRARMEYIKGKRKALIDGTKKTTKPLWTKHGGVTPGPFLVPSFFSWFFLGP